MKIGITQIILRDMSLDDIARLCQEAGYEAVELSFAPDAEPDLNATVDDTAAIRQRFADIDVEISSVIVGGADRGSLISPDPEQRDRQKANVARGVELAQQVGADSILIHPGQLVESAQYDRAWEWCQQALRELAPTAEEHGVNIAIENVWNKFLLSPVEMRTFIDQIGHPNIGVYLDVGNMVLYGYPQHWIRILEGRIKKVHFKDFSRKDHRFVHLREGDVNWEDTMAALREIDYDLPVIHEVGGAWEDHIKQAAAMREIVNL